MSVRTLRNKIEESKASSTAYTRVMNPTGPARYSAAAAATAPAPNSPRKVKQSMLVRSV